MGGRGSGSGGPSLGGGSGKNINIISSQDVWSYRHRAGNEGFVDQINTGIRNISDDFPGMMNTVRTVDSAKLGGADANNVLGFWSADGQLALNENYTNVEKMNQVYDASIKSGYHPGRGNKTGTYAVATHEAGHALTDHLREKMGEKSIDSAAKKIVDAAYKKAKGKGGTVAWAAKISGYAKESNAECIAEAVSDWYCNGNKANANSIAIIQEMKRIYAQ